MIKRIAIAIVVLPVSFAILWVALAVITFYIGALGASLADIFKISFAGLSQNPQAVAQTAQTAWENMIKQDGQNPLTISNLVSVHAQSFGTLYEPALFPWFAGASAIGALIFASSGLSVGVGRALLIPRRLITGVITWSYSFALFFSILVTLAFALGGFYVGFAAGFTPQTTNSFTTIAQAKANVQKPVDDAVLAFDAQHGVTITFGALIIAFLFGVYLAVKLIRSDWLPWCRQVVPPTTFSAVGYRTS